MIYNINAIIGYIAIHDQRINNLMESDLTLPKLQKLLFFLQGHFLATHNKPLFENEIEHWMHGAVVVDIFYKLKDIKGSVVEEIIKNDYSVISEEDIKEIDKILDYYCQFSPSKLFKMCIETDVWKDTKNNEIIKQEDLKSFFSMPFRRHYHTKVIGRRCG